MKQDSSSAETKRRGSRAQSHGRQQSSSGELTRDDKAMRRRAFIWKRLNSADSVTDAEIKQAAPKEGFDDPKAGSLIEDATFFEKLGLPVERERGKFVLVADNRPTSYQRRKDLQEEEKEAIGQLTTALLWGRDPKKHASEVQEQLLRELHDMEGRTTSPREDDRRLPSKLKHALERYKQDLVSSEDQQLVEEVIGAIHPYTDGKSRHIDYSLHSISHKVRQFLEDYWTKRHRVVALDSGTTTLAVARRIAGELNLEGKLSSLRIVTNSPEIESLLQPPEKAADVIGVGGMLRKDTSARTGLLAETCLRAWNIRFDVAIVGATSLRCDHQRRPLAFACDSEQEARTKSLFLEFATLRCVVMDSSKCSKHSSSTFAFSAVDSRLVDVVITDEKISMPDHPRRAQCQTCLDRFEERGIVVLKAKIRSTNAHQDQSSDGDALGISR